MKIILFKIFLTKILFSYQSSCTDCLSLNHEGGDQYFYCITQDTCLPYSEENLASCSNYEYHDLILNATTCCHDLQTEDVCLSKQYVSQCLYCPSYNYTDSNGQEIEEAGQCMYNNDTLNINNNCKTNPDITSPCSTYENCADCAQDIVCGWCPSMGRCVTTILDDFPYPEDQYKCTNASTKICCDNYEDCSTCSQHSGSVNAQVCNWCQLEDGTGKCVTADDKSQCTAVNELGVAYCDDKCYMGADSCHDCLQLSGCVWLENMVYSGTGPTPPLTSLCAAGGSGGPKNTTIYYQTTYTMPISFSTKDYYFMTCSLTTQQLDSLIIGLVVGIVLLVIVVYVILYIVKKIRYQKAMIIAAKKAITDDDRAMLLKRQEDFDMQEFVFETEQVSWYD